MIKYIIIASPAFLFSCKLPESKISARDNDSVVYHLRLNPLSGSEYHYDISSKMEMKVVLEGQKVESKNHSTVGVNYIINKDSTGNYVFKVLYDKVNLYSKNGDKETDADAGNAGYSSDPVEKMLGALKNSRLTAIISPEGKLVHLDGYEDLSTQLMTGLPDNVNTRLTARKHLDKLIGEGMIKQSFEQLFRIFPDSLVRIGEKWKLNSTQSNEFNLIVKNNYKLTGIEDGLASIISESEMESDPNPVAMMGYSVKPNLKRNQTGEYLVETKTGMLLNSKVEAHIEGTIQLMGKELPVKINSTLDIKGRKTKRL